MVGGGGGGERGGGGGGGERGRECSQSINATLWRDLFTTSEATPQPDHTDF